MSVDKTSGCVTLSRHCCRIEVTASEVGAGVTLRVMRTKSSHMIPSSC
jgi:hypothetical protein